MKKWFKVVAIVALLLIAGIQLVRPARTNPPTEPSRHLAARVNTPPHVAAILDRSCRDCHSNDTQWPWYSHVAPVSWFVIDHVNHGRSHFNYSEWSKYTAEQASALLKGTCELTQEGAMPLASYVRMHRSARLSAADAAALCDWASAARPIASH